LRMCVRGASKKRRSSNDEHAVKETKQVFVGGLSYDATEDDVKAFFSDCGDIAEINLERRPDGKLQGYGHVTFVTDDGATAALAKSGQDLLGRWVKVNAVHHNSKPANCNTLFVGTDSEKYSLRCL